MICNNCLKQNPDNSTFCQFCGTSFTANVQNSLANDPYNITEAPRVSQPAPTYAQPAPTYAQPAPTYAQPAAPAYAAPAAPAPVVKKHSNAGRNVFMILTIIFAALSVFMIIAAIDQSNQIDQLNNRVSVLLEKEETADFFDANAEIIGDDGTDTYHKYGCSHLDLSNGYWIYNTVAADNYAWECPYCH